MDSQGSFPWGCDEEELLLDKWSLQLDAPNEEKNEAAFLREIQQHLEVEGIFRTQIDIKRKIQEFRSRFESEPNWALYDRVSQLNERHDELFPREKEYWYAAEIKMLVKLWRLFVTKMEGNFDDADSQNAFHKLCTENGINRSYVEISEEMAFLRKKYEAISSMEKPSKWRYFDDVRKAVHEIDDEDEEEDSLKVALRKSSEPSQHTRSNSFHFFDCWKIYAKDLVKSKGVEDGLMEQFHQNLAEKGIFMSDAKIKEKMSYFLKMYDLSKHQKTTFFFKDLAHEIVTIYDKVEKAKQKLASEKPTLQPPPPIPVQVAPKETPVFKLEPMLRIKSNYKPIVPESTAAPMQTVPAFKTILVEAPRVFEKVEVCEEQSYEKPFEKWTYEDECCLLNSWKIYADPSSVAIDQPVEDSTIQSIQEFMQKLGVVKTEKEIRLEMSNLKNKFRRELKDASSNWIHLKRMKEIVVQANIKRRHEGVYEGRAKRAKIDPIPKPKIGNTNMRCRICLKNAKFLASMKQKMRGESVENIFTKLTGFPIKSNQPKFICRECLNSLIMILKFHQLCRETEATLVPTGKSQNNPFLFKSGDDLTIKTEPFLSQEENICDEPQVAIEIDIVKNEEEIYKDSLMTIYDDHNYNSDIPAPEETENTPNQSSTKIPCNFCWEEYKGQCKCPSEVPYRLPSPIPSTSDKLIPFSHCCELCGLTFTSRVLWQRHRAKHLNEKIIDILCPGCGRHFDTRSKFLSHKRRCYMKRVRYECYHCGKTFYEKGDMRSHVETHSSQLYYECKICSKQLKTCQGLERHRKRHRAIHNYECPVCYSKYTENKMLRNHIERVHQDYVLPPKGTAMAGGLSFSVVKKRTEYME